MPVSNRRFTYMMPLAVGAIEDHMGGRDAATIDGLVGPAENDPTPSARSADLWEV